MSYGYVSLVLVTLLIGCFSTWYVNSRLRKYSRVPTSTGLTGAQAARCMLRYYGIQGVSIRRGKNGEDFFDPKTNSVTLGPDSYDVRSVTAIATACHEVGHAYQYAEGYTPMKIRGAIVPVANVASNAWIFILIVGIMLNWAGLVNLAILLYAAVVIFELVTLPVEFNASNRALTYMSSTGISESEQTGARSVLRACAFTYVAAALSSVLQLLWLLGQRQD